MHGIMKNDFMFSGRSVVPWRGIGTVLDGVFTSEERGKQASSICRNEWKKNL